MPMIKLNDIVVKFGDFEALHNINWAEMTQKKAE